jgi:hypothetical protein
MIRGLPGGDQVRTMALAASAFKEDQVVVLTAGCDGMAVRLIEEERQFEEMGEPRVASDAPDMNVMQQQVALMQDFAAI